MPVQCTDLVSNEIWKKSLRPKLDLKYISQLKNQNKLSDQVLSKLNAIINNKKKKNQPLINLLKVDYSKTTQSTPEAAESMEEEEVEEEDLTDEENDEDAEQIPEATESMEESDRSEGENHGADEQIPGAESMKEDYVSDKEAELDKSDTTDDSYEDTPPQYGDFYEVFIGNQLAFDRM